jgi:hypothetical protein
MTNQAKAQVTEDQRIFVRVPVERIIAYQHGPDTQGVASCRNVCQAGACVRLDRYLRPGTYAMLAFDPLCENDARVELKARVAWCRRANGNGGFMAGVRVFDDEPDATRAFSELVNQAEAGATGHVVEKKDWRE